MTLRLLPPTPYPIRKIAGPVLAISTGDYRFGTANRAKYIVANVPDALRNITSFLQTVQQRRTPR